MDDADSEPQPSALGVVTVTNPQAMAKYRDFAGTTLAKHGGEAEYAA